MHWLALRMVGGLGTRQSVRLIQVLRSPQAVFRCSASELRAHGLSGSVAQSIASGCAYEDAVEQQQRLRAAAATLVPISDPRYPPLLREIFDPPLVLFARGNLVLLDSLMLGVVGTRNPSPYGLAAAEKLSTELSRAGLTITSGLARGIDTAAHLATLEAGGRTAAVFGCGVDEIYPAENRKLRDAILAKGGLLLSEFPMGAPAYPQNFPIRNRIISGLSLGVLVVEGAQFSGSGITARLAVDQGRELFAVPGNITSRQSWGPNMLIKQGAKLVQGPDDVLDELGVDARQRLRLETSRQLEIKALDDSETSPASPASDCQGSVGARLASLGPNEGLAKAVLRKLRPDSAIQLDQILEAIEGSSSTEIIAVLFELELMGLVRQMPGKRYLKV